MGYQLIYNSSFKDIDENTINIEIYKDSGGTLIASELLCSADAVSTMNQMMMYSNQSNVQIARLMS